MILAKATDFYKQEQFVTGSSFTSASSMELKDAKLIEELVFSINKCPNILVKKT